MWRKPANLYSTKCRFFGPTPPSGGTVVETTPPDGPGDPPGVPRDLPEQRPRVSLPERLSYGRGCLLGHIFLL